MGREICQKCKKLAQEGEDEEVEEGNTSKEEKDQQKETEMPKEEVKKREGFFARIVNFFKSLFGKG